MIKNILITGGIGYVGSHLCLKLLEQNYNITIIDNLINSKKERIKNDGREEVLEKVYSKIL